VIASGDFGAKLKTYVCRGFTEATFQSVMHSIEQLRAELFVQPKDHEVVREV
jgi:hypothetical protein